MMLIELKHYLKRVKKANLGQLCQQFKAEPAFIRMLLEQWIGKGKVRKADAIPGCGTLCVKCLPDVVEIYEWVE